MTKEETQPLNIDSLLQPILECEPQNSWPLLLSKLIDSYPQSAELSYRVAVILEQIGALPESEKAYFHCLTLAPKNYLVYLYLGHLLEKKGEDSTALVCYTLCEALTGSFKRLQLTNSTAPQTLERFQKAWQCMEKNLGTASSIESARWVQYCSKPFETAQSPHLFYVANLRAHPIWPRSNLHGMKALTLRSPTLSKSFTIRLIAHLHTLRLICRVKSMKAHFQCSQIVTTGKRYPFLKRVWKTFQCQSTFLYLKKP